MSTVESNPRTYLVSHSPIEQQITAFLIDRQARGLSPSTIQYYREKLATFRAYCIAQGVNSLYAITPRLVRSFLLELAKTQTAWARVMFVGAVCGRDPIRLSPYYTWPPGPKTASLCLSAGRTSGIAGLERVRPLGAP